jgi:3D (Asp-Asp-Asp) domain-containing protein
MFGRALFFGLFLGLGACAAAAKPVPHGPPSAVTTTAPTAPDGTLTPPDVPAPPTAFGELVPGFRITNYTLARETELSGQRTGNRTRISAKGLPGQWPWEFLCSGRGVAMQGTGITADGKYVHYVRGGGGFCGRDQHLCNCKNAEFTLTTGVFGSTGRALTENFSIAVDPSVIPYGSFVWIDAMKRWFRADDTGGAIVGRHIDVYVGTQPFVFNGESAVFVANEPHQPTDPGPPGANVACTRRGRVCGAPATSGEAQMLLECTGDHLTFARACTWGCQPGRGGADDACKPRPPNAFCAADGFFCGGDRVEGAGGVLYRCADHALRVDTVCERGCAVDADGIGDHCW